jgi:hypothetical protein
VERDTGLLILRAAALAFWIACVVFVVVPLHGKHAASFHGGDPAHPKYTTAVAN